MSKRSQHPRYDDPTAFGQQFPAIVPDATVQTAVMAALEVQEQGYKMGEVKATVSLIAAGYFMTVRCKRRYPSWDEIVWLRYHLIPDAAVMSLVLPNLDNYINLEGTTEKNVFTMEQKGWALRPVPVCQNCDAPEIDFLVTNGLWLTFKCKVCGYQFDVDAKHWNEEHGHGLLAKETETSHE